jgi:hypothetical protein
MEKRQWRCCARGGYVVQSGGFVSSEYAADGTLLGSVDSFVNGSATQHDYMGPSGSAYAHLLVTSSGATVTMQDVDGAWNTQDAQEIIAGGGDAGSYDALQFNSAWVFQGATGVQVEGNTTYTERFDSAWAFQGATAVDVEGSTTYTEQFDSGWNFQGATSVDLEAGATYTDRFDPSWTFQGATVVQVSGNTTFTEQFNSAWAFQGATTVQSYGATNIDQSFDSSWTLTGYSVVSALGGGLSQTATYTANNVLTGVSEQQVTSGTAGPEVFTGGTGVATTVVFTPGAIDGDAFASFVTGQDRLEFDGYGPGAALTEIDATHWRLTALGHASEVFTVTGSFNPATDAVFKA